jgi:molybdate transport system permease protein
MSSKASSITDRTFMLVSMGSLVFIILFLLGIIISMISYVNLSTFASTLTSDEVLFSINLSIFTATLALAMSIAIGVPAAYALSRTDFPGKSIIETILDIPIVMPPISLGAALLIFFSTPLGITIQQHTIQFVFEPAGLVLAQFTIISALAIRLMKDAFDNINPRYEQAARTLGCNRLYAFAYVTLPLARNSLLSSIILCWARAVGEFGASVMLAGATRMKTETLPIAIFLQFGVADITKAVTTVFILIVISVAVLLAMRKIGGRGPV